MLAIGIALLIAADLVLALGQLSWRWRGIALWGLHMGFTQGLLSAMVADTAPAELRGTAFGVFNLAAAWPCWRPACCRRPLGRSGPPRPSSRALPSRRLDLPAFWP